MKLFDSELRVMEVLWSQGDRTAKQIAETLGERIGWNVNTTYTVIKKCVAKGAVERREPGFLCHALVSKEAVRQDELGALVDRLFDGSADLLFASLLHGPGLSRESLEELRRWVEEQP